MIPDKENAELILMEAERNNPGDWAAHSRVTAQIAEKIATYCNGIDAEKAYVLGLLHDIGRQFGISQMRHIYDGYRYMLELGYDEVARVCLTHSFQCHDIYDYVGTFDITKEQQNELERILVETTFNDYDLLIQLCDTLAGKNGSLRIEERIEDLISRYGTYPQKKMKRNFELKEYFEKFVGQDLYNILLL